MNEKNIREQLSKTLIDDPNNYSRIIELSSKLAKFDEENIRFSIDAGVIDRLGSELVARQETAVSELVKNSYDADATRVNIKFENSDEIGGTLYIEDNGTGMNREQLINGFMRISSSSKIHNPVSDLYNRKRAGQKGIGRFAVQRLAEKLTITTQTESDNIALVLSINWNEYSNDLDLNTITNKIFTKNKTKDKGTILKIEGLKDKWSEASIKRIYKYIGDILQPFPLPEIEESLENEFERINIDPGFKVYFSKIVNGRQINIVDDKMMVYNYATAIINGWVDENGYGLYSVESKQFNINEITELSSDPDEDNVPYKYLKKVKFRAYYFIYADGLVPKMQETSIRKLARTQGGIRLYRNGFRVLPYGEANNDWLGLDESVKRRSILPVHSNLNFFGFVELKDNENIFNETSSREGLIETEAVIELKNFVYRSILSSVIKVAEIRNIKIVSGQKQDEDGIYESVEVRIKNIAFTLEELDRELEKETGNIEVQKRRKKKFDQVKREIAELQKAQEEEKEQFLKERSMLRVLSSVGLTIGLFLHEVKDYILNMDNNVSFLIEKLKNDQMILHRLTLLQSNIESFNTYTSYFDSVISQNVSRNIKPIDLKKTINNFWKTIENDLIKNNIKLEEPELFGNYLLTCPMHPSEWSSILFNLFSNSKKAIKRSNNIGKINIECGKFENKLYLKFSDSGDGIKDEIKERIFEEFFTTSSPNSIDKLEINNEFTGTGLGLKIVKDIITSYRGKIFVDEPKESFSTTIYIEIPAATEKELDKYGL
ncbi:Histidine kinase-, DNA gyrase B-, and HSP90-like ATPase [Flavobacterium anhuiense]|uniref:Histidine kinase-, DNA gyrase B-, and HSP90-like ATPase n=1 Tax=Flavobacterium anhuiense TaxID=459526 RepID=A0ABY0LQ84_9FLAO|nr:sensor histidine kinase [Flavobacterium anhuiense]SCY49706.1 Histidine kinase-, DNA gyrase B-, and HSP90-like ATPase [Flavobacterium anhuiense]